MSYTAFCIVDGPEMSAAVVSSLGRAGFTDAEISITPSPLPRFSGILEAKVSLASSDAFRNPVGRRSVVGATLGLIATLGIITMLETGRDGGSYTPQTMLEGKARIDSKPSTGVAAETLERVWAIAYHLSPGRSLIAVRTNNSYEIETILEIFRERGAIHCTNIVEDGGPDSQQSLTVSAMPVRDHTTILNDRLRESA